MNLLATGQAVSAQLTPGSGAPAYDMAGSVVTYAGGRQRAIAAAGLHTAIPVGLRLVSRTDLDTLVSWQGLPVQIRDYTGWRFFAVYYSVAPARVRGLPTVWDVTLAARSITVAEGV